MKTTRTIITAAVICIAMCSAAETASTVHPFFGPLAYNANSNTFSVTVMDVNGAGNPFNKIGIFIDNKVNAGTFQLGGTQFGSSPLSRTDLFKIRGPSDYTFSNSPKQLTWSTTIDPGIGAFSWWAAAFKPGKAYLISDEQKVAATPIPGAAWLLGSGILGLVGLRRRSKYA